MEKDRAVTYEKEKQLAEQTGLEFFETSAKDNVSVTSGVWASSWIYYEWRK